MCQAQAAAYLIAQDAIDQLLDALPASESAGSGAELGWRTGPFRRVLSAAGDLLEVRSVPGVCAP